MSKSPASVSAEGSPAPAAAAAVESQESEIGAALRRRREYREVTLALHSGLRDARADFSFLRSRGLRKLVKFLQSAAADPEVARLFCHSQSLPDLQVIPVLFENTLQHPKENPVVTLDHIFGIEPMKITSPATDSEFALALRVLEGCCLLSSGCAALAYKYRAIQVLLNILSSRGRLEQMTCLDALLSLMLDSTQNQMEFEECEGLGKVAELLNDGQVDEDVRLKCGEFLLLLVGHIHGKENTPLADIHENIRGLFGEECASLIWAASQFGTTLSAEQRQTALQIQARRVVEFLEPF